MIFQIVYNVIAVDIHNIGSQSSKCVEELIFLKLPQFITPIHCCFTTGIVRRHLTKMISKSPLGFPMYI